MGPRRGIFNMQKVSKIILTSCVTALIAASCGSTAATKSSTSTSSSVQQHQSITLAAAKDGNDSAQVILADKLGLFKKAGLDVNVRYFASGGAVVQAVAGRSIEVGAAGTVPVETLGAGHFPVQILASMANITGAQQIMALPSITSAKQLVGQSFGELSGTVSQLLAVKYLQSQHVNPSSVNMVNMSPSAMVTALDKHQIAAAALWEPLSAVAQQNGDRLLASGTTDFSNGSKISNNLFSDHTVIFTQSGWAKSNPVAAQDLLKALIQANDYLKTNTTQAESLLANFLGVSSKIVAGEFAVNSYGIRLSKDLVTGMQGEVDFLHSEGVLSSDPKVTYWIDPSPLASVDSKAVSIS